MIPEIIVFGFARRADAIERANDLQGNAVVLCLNLPSNRRVVPKDSNERKRGAPMVEQGFFPALEHVAYLVVDKAFLDTLEDVLETSQ